MTGRFAGALLSALSMVGVAGAADFPGANTGAIPDNNPAGRGVVFVVDGMTAPLADVRISMGLTHAFARDLQATLVSPDGRVHRFVFGSTGLHGVGSQADLAGIYRFHDHAPGDWWAAAAAAATGVIPSGDYRTSTIGVRHDLTSVKSGGCANLLSHAFNGLTPGQINGIWTLNIADLQASDAGTIDSAVLTLIEAGDPLFGNGFDRPVRGSCVRAQFDYTGSNRSSYVLVRNTGGGAGGAITWTIRDNDGTTTGFERSVQLGVASDHFLGGDFDGDGMWDPTVWSGSTGTYKVHRSSRPNDPPMEIVFGQQGDDPVHIGDYDGDGRHDFAVHRSGATAGSPSFTIVRLSSTGLERILATGANGQFAVGGYDMSGDGIADVAMQRNAGGDVAEFNVYSGVNGALLATFQHETATHVIIGGNHAGNARADTMTVRGVGGVLNWSVRDSNTGAVSPVVLFGVSATDYPLSGDFDGDGRDDHAIWRRSAIAGVSRFQVRSSIAPHEVIDVPMGANGDYPVLNVRSH